MSSGIHPIKLGVATCYVIRGEGTILSEKELAVAIAAGVAFAPGDVPNHNGTQES